MMTASGELLTLRDYVELLRRWWWLPTIGLVAGVGVGLLSVQRSETTYAATAQILATDLAARQVPMDEASGERTIATLTELLKSTIVQEEVQSILEIDSAPPEVQSSSSRLSDVITIRADLADPVESVAVVNAFAEALINVRNQSVRKAVAAVSASFDTRLDEIEQSLRDVQADSLGAELLLREGAGIADDRRDLEVQVLLTEGATMVVSPAEEAVAIEPASFRRTSLAGFVGLIGGLAVVVMCELVRRHPLDSRPSL